MGEEDPKKAKLVEKLAGIKDVDHSDIGQYIIKSNFCDDERVRELLGEKDVLVPAGILETPAIKKEADVLLKDIRDFLTKLYHDTAIEEKKPKEKQEPSSNDIFVGSLSEAPKKPKARKKEDFQEEEDEPIRKNRPGQRARRMLWEQKYGQSANHLASMESEKIEKKKYPKKTFAKNSERFDDSWDRKKEPIKIQVENRTKQPVITKHKATEDIHPSWAAKLQQKQRLLQAASSEPAKIVFEDSD